MFYDASRKLILKGVDGVIFVADSQRERMDANVESLRNLEANLKTQGYDIRSIPYVLQLNKRDLPSAVPVEEMKAKLCINNEPVLEAIAASEEGIGVFGHVESRRQARPPRSHQDAVAQPGFARAIISGSWSPVAQRWSGGLLIRRLLVRIQPGEPTFQGPFRLSG